MKVTEQLHEKTISTVIAERRSTPRFAPTPVAKEDLRQIVVAGLESPSGYNLQPWRFVVVQSPEQRRKLRVASYDQPKIEQAPVVVVRRRSGLEGRLDELLERVSEVDVEEYGPARRASDDGDWDEHGGVLEFVHENLIFRDGQCRSSRSTNARFDLGRCKKRARQFGSRRSSQRRSLTGKPIAG